MKPLTANRTLDLAFKVFDVEAFIVRRLGEHGSEVYAGITDRDTRRERIRAAIIDGKHEAAIIGKTPAGKAETYAACFERFYGQPLGAKCE